MKKLIMFLMMLAIGAPALAIMEDLSPPDWGGILPRCTYVWHMDTEEYGEPSCINYDPLVEDPVIFWGAPGSENPTGDPVGSWNQDPCNGDFTFNYQDVGIYVEAPPGAGPHLTIRIQAEFEVGPNFWTFLETHTWDDEEGRIDPRSELAGEFVPIEEEGEPTGMWVMEGTFTPDNLEVGEMPKPGEKALIGFFCEEAANNTMTGLIIDVIRHDGDAPTTGPGRVICDPTEPLPFLVDPNIMIVYETDETRGDFDVYLARPPFSGTVTVVVDPNGGNGGWGEGQNEDKDIELLKGVGPDNQITMTFDAGNWDVPQTVVFDALEDTAPEPPELLEGTMIGLTLSHPTDPNFDGQRIVVVNVMDNDQANILFSVTPPVWLKEEPIGEDWFGDPIYREVTVGVTLQVQPSGDPVRILLAHEVDDEAINPNLPTMDPPYCTACDPNVMIFDSGDWNIPQNIVLTATDDELLQIEGAEGEGDEKYTAAITFTVVDGGGDDRYWKQVPELDEYGVPTGEMITIRLEKSLQIDIEDNECGAFGIMPEDISNPYYVTDPNWLDNDGNPLPDCYLNIHDVIEMAKRWLNCSDPQDDSCVSYLE